MEINKIYCGNSLNVLKTFPDKVFQCCITSPPFFGLRSYNTGKWIGGSQDCVHDTIPARNGRGGSGPNAKQTAIPQNSRLRLAQNVEQYMRISSSVSNQLQMSIQIIS
jgi:DNA modification methylase